MFLKMFKHDMKATWRYWWIIALSTVVMTLLGIGAYRYILYSASLETEGAAVFAVLLCTLVFGICVFGIVGSYIAVELIVYIRYYKHFFTDEGYLTFTLPVSRKALLLSKTLSAVIWTFAQTLLIVGSMVFLVIGLVPEEEGILGIISITIKELWMQYGAWIIAYAFAALLAVIATVAYSVCMVQFCITIGAVIAKKAKLIVAIAIFYGINSVSSFLGQIISSVYMILMAAGLEGVLKNASETLIHALILVAILLAVVMICAVTAVMYFWTLGNLERKLNLP